MAAPYFTDDDDLAQMIRSIRVHGQGSDKYDNVRIGVNGAWTTIQAAVSFPNSRSSTTK